MGWKWSCLRKVWWNGKRRHIPLFCPHLCPESKLAIFLSLWEKSFKVNKHTYAHVQNGCWKRIPSKQNLASQLKGIQMILEICCCKIPEESIIFRSVHSDFQMGSSLLLSKFNDKVLFSPWENWMKNTICVSSIINFKIQCVIIWCYDAFKIHLFLNLQGGIH